jgi:hypothetical protein
VLWALFYVVLASYFSLLAPYNFFLAWALDHVSPLGSAWFYSAVQLFDLILSLILTLPFALAIRLYAGAPPHWVVFAASVALCLWQYEPVYSSYPDSLSWFATPRAIAGLAHSMFLLPLAYYLAHTITGGGHQLTSQDSKGASRRDTRSAGAPA